MIVHLREYQPHTLELSPPEVAALTAANVRVSPTGEGRFEVVPQATVGTLSVDGTTFVLQPKVGIRRLLLMVSYATDRVLDDRWAASVDDDAELLPAMAWLFARASDRATAAGVRRGYRRIQETAPTVRGRIDIAEQLRRHHARTFPVEVDYDDYTIDTDANRLLLAAALRLRQLGRLPLGTRRRLARTVARLDGVTPTRWRTGLPDVRLTRLDAHYGVALRLAKLVLLGRSVEPIAGTTQMTSVLFNLNDVFEDFVVAGLRERLALDERTFPQNGRGRRLDLAPRVGLSPDLSWWHGDRCVFIGDVKYKRVSAAGIKHPDLYQLLAYAVAADLPNALLVYAAGGHEVPAVHEVAHIGRRLTVLAMRLDGPLQELSAELDRAAAQVRALRTEAESHQLAPLH